MNTLCSLKFKEAIELIQNHSQVYYKHGVWNKYERWDTPAVISSIQKSGYGADVREKDGELYVSIPADCDMW